MCNFRIHHVTECNWEIVYSKKTIEHPVSFQRINEQFWNSSTRHGGLLPFPLGFLFHLRIPLALNVEISQNNPRTPVFSLDILAIQLPAILVPNLASRHFQMQERLSEELQLYDAKHFGQIQLFKPVSGAAFQTETNTVPVYFTLGWENAV